MPKQPGLIAHFKAPGKQQRIYPTYTISACRSTFQNITGLFLLIHPKGSKKRDGMTSCLKVKPLDFQKTKKSTNQKTQHICSSKQGTVLQNHPAYSFVILTNPAQILPDP